MSCNRDDDGDDVVHNKHLVVVHNDGVVHIRNEVVHNDDVVVRSTFLIKNINYLIFI